MRKIELQELIQDYLSGGDMPDDVKGKYHDEIILNHMNTAFKAIVFATWLEAKNHADYSVLDAWAREYTVAITSVSGTNGTVILPFPPMQLPDNRGILQVTPENDLTNPFIYLETNSQGAWSVLEAGSVMTEPEFYLEQNASSTSNTDTHQLKVSKIPSGVTNVKVKMIVPLSVIDLYDEVMIPAGKEDLMVRGVTELLRGKPAEDVINDNITRQ